uniref:Uncharacterized protein n=1 Tax=Coturnix japonica TaxID=93934 RepID=A0A8C2U406_COTJA
DSGSHRPIHVLFPLLALLSLFTGELDATSRMAWENRIALDMMLAEKGCVCVMLGTHCCTFIPNNTAPDVTITKHCWGLLPLPVNWQKIQE